MARNRRYSELVVFDTFEDRFEYLKLGGSVGQSTFGFDRHINQRFYHSAEWKSIRTHVISRDNGCDLGIRGHEVNGALLIHHINPIDVSHIVHYDEEILDPENLITTTQDTHNAIHYGDRSLLRLPVAPRGPGDTKLW